MAGARPAAANAPVMKRRRHGYGLVLVLVIASTAFQLVVSSAVGPRFAIIALQAATLVAAVRTADVQRTGVRLAAAAATLAVAASLVTWIAQGEIPHGFAAVVGALLVGVAPAVLAAGLFNDLRARGGVAVHTLAGVLAIYLLIGMFFAFTYGIVDAVDSSALFVDRQDSTPADRAYFSFVTLSTVGYGDFSPAADAPRALAVAEMLTGQIYLVTIVSLIVANLGSRRRE
jgi:glucan phosphoethanolaminetransferase (alkaline phosphatase superfamily)